MMVLAIAKISFFNALKHTCLIIFSIDFLIQPPDLNEMFWMVYNILIPLYSCQKVGWQIMPEHYKQTHLLTYKASEDSCAVASQGAFNCQ